MDSTPPKDLQHQPETKETAKITELSESQLKEFRLAALNELTRLSQELGMGYEK